MACLIVGLGNPGKKYEMTRHNLGFIVLKALAEQKGFSFKINDSLEGAVATGEWEEKKVYFLLPLTYVNLSGRAVKKTMDYYKIPIEAVLVVVDDVNLNFNTMRLRNEGSSGGHNGLKSIEATLHTKNYARLRMGVGPQEENIILEDYVLGKFRKEEQNSLPEFITRAHDLIATWVKEGQQLKEERNP